jgi:hypothetical protein
MVSLFLHDSDDIIQVYRAGDFRDSEIKAKPEVELHAGFEHGSKVFVRVHDRTAFSKVKICI